MHNGTMQYIASPKVDHMYELIELRERLEQLLASA